MKNIRCSYLFLSPLLLLISCSALPQSTDISTLPPDELSVMAENIGDSLALAGCHTQAIEYYIMGAVALDPDDSLRIVLTDKAVVLLDGPSVVCAELLIGAGDSLAPYRALQIGGAAMAERILYELESGAEYVLPWYLSLVLADTLLSAGNSEAALTSLRHVPDGLPSLADEMRTVLYSRAYLGNDEFHKADSIIASAESVGDTELLSILYHHRGMWKLDKNILGYMDDILYSFDLWPAAPVHAAAFDTIKAELMSNPEKAAEAADAFYSGGLWNEIYELALEMPSPDPHIYYLAAQTRRRLGFYRISIDMLENYLSIWSDEEDAPNAMISLGRIYGKIGEVEQGINIITEYTQTFPQHYRHINSPWYFGYIYFQNGMYGESVEHFKELVEKYPSNVLVDDCHFLLAVALYEEDRIPGCKNALLEFIDLREASVYHSSARYLLGKILLEHNTSEGTAVLLDLIEDAPYSLPAYFARELLNIPDWEPSITHEPLAEWMTANGMEPVTTPQAALNGLFLVEAGLRELAMGEFFRAENEVGNAGKLAVFYYNSEIWERRPYAAWQVWNIAGSSASRPIELWKMRYQQAWPKLVVPLCEKYDIEPYFIWGIVRNESMFRPWTYSVAGARGLIQMIPSTSEYVAMEQGWDDYSPDKLYDPAVSLEYGICYISGLNAEFGCEPVFTAASYNAGPHNAVEWGSYDFAPDDFFLRIIYDETRGYAQRVHFAQRIYSYLYGHQ